MKKLWNKILDLFGIEHHEIGTLRIVQMSDGMYYVQQWDFGYESGEGLGWRFVRHGLIQISFKTLKEAQHVYDLALQKRKSKTVPTLTKVVAAEKETQ